MASNAIEVFKAEVPSVGLTLKVRAAIDGKQSAYTDRIANDPVGSYSDGLVEYRANLPWKVSFNESVVQDVDAGAIVKARPAFFETKYFFRGSFKDSPKPIKDVQINHRLASVSDSFNYDDGILVGTLDFVNEPGRFRLELKVIFEDNSWQLISFEFYVVSVKMNILRDYDEILKTIDKARPRLAQSFLGKSFWGAQLGGENKNDDKTWYQILEDVFQYYMRAVKRIANNPHQRYVRVDEYRRADHIKRWTPALALKFNRLGPSEQAHALFRTARVEGAIDTPENRFVLFTLRELARRLEKFATAYESDDKVSKSWFDGVRAMVDDLKKLARHPFFVGVGRFAGFKQQSLVMQKQAGYAQVFTVWHKLKRALTPGGNDVDISYRPISMLYEFWCFLKMREMLTVELGEPTKDEVKTSSEDELLETPELMDGDEIKDEALSKLVVEFEKGGAKYSLVYQKTYNVRDLNGTDEESFSSLNPQRPDIVLTIAADGNEYSYLFDAKYRVWQVQEKGCIKDATTRDAIDAMYRYRDAILYRMQKAGIKREIIGAYVLYPGRKAPHLYEPYKTSIEKEGIGAIPLLPGFEDELKKNLTTILDRHTPTAHLEIATSVRGTSTVVGEAMSEASIPTIELAPNAWPSLTDDMNKCVALPLEQKSRIKNVPCLVRLRSNNKAEVIVKFVSRHSWNEESVVYNIEWTSPGNV